MWKKLTIDDLRLVLSEDETEKLSTISLDSSVSANVIQNQLDMVTDMFRGAWQAKGYNVDIRDHYCAPEYITPVLNYARWQIFTRFPMTEDYSLSEPRKAGYEEAVELLKNPYVGTSRPDYSDDPDLSGRTDLNSTHDDSIKIPFQRFPSEIWEYGFPQVYPWCVRS